MTGFRCLGNRTNRTVVGAGIIFGDPDQKPGDGQANHHGIEQCPTSETAGAIGHYGIHITAECLICDITNRRNRSDCGDQKALIHRTHDVGTAAQTDEKGSQNRGQNADTTNNQWQRHQVQQFSCWHRSWHQQGKQNHRCANGHNIGFKQVGRHTSTIPNVIADIIGDRRRVAGVILRNICFDLTDEVSADVRSLGKYTTAQTRKDRNQRSAERQCQQTVNNRTAVRHVHRDFGEIIEETGNREQSKTSNEHTGNRTGIKRHSQAFLEAFTSGLRSTDVGANRDVHPNKAGRTRQHSAKDETDRRQRPEEHTDQNRNDDANNGDSAILAGQIGASAFLDSGCNFLHPRCAGRCSKHRAACYNSIKHGNKPAQYSHN